MTHILTGSQRLLLLLPALVVILPILLLATGHQASAQEERCLPEGSALLNTWETNFCERAVELDEITWGGVPRDGIPPIDNPSFESIDAAEAWLQEQSPVIAVSIGDEARAYPLAILTRHEIVNDNFSDLPVAVTYCPLCNSALVFERQIDGQTLRLGVSGMLRNSDLIMWDDVTESWWQQLTGEAIIGDFVGRQLPILPSQIVSFGAFKQQFPDGIVLDDGNGRYGRNPYVGYDTNPRPFLFTGQIDTRLDSPTERVLAATIQGESIAYPFSILS
ncbi:MAG: DUF3179 domain-containing protein, partial [Chloroflexota bacterium]